MAIDLQQGKKRNNTGTKKYIKRREPILSALQPPTHTQLLMTSTFVPVHHMMLEWPLLVWHQNHSPMWEYITIHYYTFQFANLVNNLYVSPPGQRKIQHPSTQTQKPYSIKILPVWESNSESEVFCV